MRTRTSVAIALSVAALALLVVPAAATATDFVASPTGGGSACTDLSPCSLTTAVADANLGAAGDNAVLQPGTYTLTSDVGVIDGLKPETPGTRPLLTSNTGLNVSTFSASARIEDIGIDVSGPSTSRVLDLLSGGTADRIAVVANVSDGLAVQIRDGSFLLDSTVWNKVAGGTAIISGSGGGTLRNVAAIATGATSTGLSNFINQAQTINIENSILHGGDRDINVDGGTSATTVNTSYSDAPNAVHFGTMTTFNLGPGNIAGAPLLANQPAGDFHEVAGSPTIDAGFPVAGLGAFALDGQARTIGSAPDIGADEYQPPTTPATPSSTTSPQHRKRCRRHRRHHKSSIAAKRKCRHKKRR